MIFNTFGNRRERPFHSSGYARVARGNAMGALSTQSFGQRQHLERSRQTVGRYSSSYVAYGGSHLHDNDDAMPARNSEDRTSLRTPGARSATGGPRLQVPGRKIAFVEPPARYNPYQ